MVISRANLLFVCFVDRCSGLRSPRSSHIRNSRNLIQQRLPNSSPDSAFGYVMMNNSWYYRRFQADCFNLIAHSLNSGRNSLGNSLFNLPQILAVECPNGSASHCLRMGIWCGIVYRPPTPDVSYDSQFIKYRSIIRFVIRISCFNENNWNIKIR